MTKADLARTLTGERERAIAILRRAGWKMPAIARVLGKQDGVGDVDDKIDRIAKALCKELERFDWAVTVDNLKGASAERRFAAPRNAAMWLAREILGASFPAIGAFFDRDHSTVISACKPDAKWKAIDDRRLELAVSVVMRKSTGARRA